MTASIKVRNTFLDFESRDWNCIADDSDDDITTVDLRQQKQISEPSSPTKVDSERDTTGSSDNNDRTDDDGPTTVMIRNLPNKYTQQMLLRVLNDGGFAPCVDFDFFYLPMDRGNGANLGYGFVNFVDPAGAAAFTQAFQGRRMRRFNSRKTIDVMPALIQGYEANRMHYAGTRVVHADDSQCRPLFLHEQQHAHVALQAINGNRTGSCGTNSTKQQSVQPANSSKHASTISSKDADDGSDRRRAGAGGNSRGARGCGTDTNCNAGWRPEQQGRESLPKNTSPEDRMSMAYNYAVMMGLPTEEYQSQTMVSTSSSDHDMSPTGTCRQMTPESPTPAEARCPTSWAPAMLPQQAPMAQNNGCTYCHSCGMSLQSCFKFCPGCATQNHNYQQQQQPQQQQQQQQPQAMVMVIPQGQYMHAMQPVAQQSMMESVQQTSGPPLHPR